MIRGACPGLFDPMRAAEAWLMRIKPPRGVLTAAQARAVARCGDAALTNRGNLQLRVADPAPVAVAMLEAGLGSEDPSAERRRTLLVPPLLGDDPSLPSNLPAVIAGLEALLAASAGLGAKFGLVVDGGGVLPLAGMGGDLHVRVTRDRVLVSPDGSGLASDAPDAAWRLLRGFLAGGAKRMRAHVAARGAAELFAAAGLAAHPFPAAARRDTMPVGFLAYPGTQRGAFGLGLPFGELGVGVFAQLAALAERFGDGTLRVTPWRGLVLTGIEVGAALALGEAVRALGGIVDPADPALRIVACPGAPDCAAGFVPARADARRLLEAGLPRAGILHVSGCAKGCAHPGPAALTLVGEADGYALVRDGAPAEARGLSLADILDRA